MGQFDPTLEAWRNDSAFRKLADGERLVKYGRYFDHEVADDDFRKLPVWDQLQVKSRFVAHQIQSETMRAMEAPSHEPRRVDPAADAMWDSALVPSHEPAEAEAALRTPAEAFGEKWHRRVYEAAGDLGTILGDMWARSVPRTAADWVKQPYNVLLGPLGVGGVEAVGNLVSGLASSAAGGVAALGSMFPSYPEAQFGMGGGSAEAAPADERLRAGAEAIESFHGLAYKPKTREGQAVSRTAGLPFELLADLGRMAGEYVFRATGSPGAATAVGTTIEGLPVLLGAAAGIRGGLRQRRFNKQDSLAGKWAEKLYGIGPEAAKRAAAQANSARRHKPTGDVDIGPAWQEELHRAVKRENPEAAAAMEGWLWQERFKRQSPGPTLEGPEGRAAPAGERLPAGQGFILRPVTRRRTGKDLEPASVWMIRGTEPSMPEVFYTARGGRPFVSRTSAARSRSAKELAARGFSVEPFRIPGGWGLKRVEGGPPAGIIPESWSAAGAAGVGTAGLDRVPPGLAEGIPAPAPRTAERRKEPETRADFERLLAETNSVEEARALARTAVEQKYTDPLTGLKNRAAWEEFVQDDMTSATPRLKAMADLDNFGSINTIFGHGHGDEVLRTFGRIIKEEGVEAYRYGGEEIVMVGDDIATLESQIRRVRDRMEREIDLRLVADQPIELSDGTRFAPGDILTQRGVGLSYGIDREIKRADAASEVQKSQRRRQGIRAAKGARPPRLLVTIPGELPAGELPRGDVRQGEEGVPAGGSGTGIIPPAAAPPAAAPPAAARTATVYTPRNNPVEIEYRVVEAGGLTASHDLEGRKDTRYPRELQPRDRSRLTSRLQIRAIRRTMVEQSPELLGPTLDTDKGAPVVGPDLVVEGGNGRVLAVRSAYQAGTAGAYRQMILDQADSLGLDAGRIGAMSEPVLIRVRTGEIPDRAEFARELNESGAARMSSGQQAAADAARLQTGDIELLSPGESGNLAAASNYPFIRRFLERLGQQEGGGLITSSGEPTQQLIQRMQAAVFAKVYRHDKLVNLMAEEADPGIRNILNALVKAAPDFLRAQAKGDPAALGYDVGPRLAEATALVMESKRRGAQSLDRYLNQQGLFGRPPEDVASLAIFLDNYKRSVNRIAFGLGQLAESIGSEVERSGNIEMFERTRPTFGELVGRAVRQVEEQYGRQEGSQGTLFEHGPQHDPVHGGGGEQPGRGRTASGGTGLREDRRIGEADESLKPLKYSLYDDLMDRAYRPGRPVTTAEIREAFPNATAIEELPQGFRVELPNGQEILVVKDTGSLAFRTTRAETTSPRFKKWFGKSVLVDDAGRPLRLLHGSTRTGTESFTPGVMGGTLGNGIYLTERPDVADAHTHPSRAGIDRGAIYPLHARVERPLVLEAETWGDVGGMPAEAEEYWAVTQREIDNGIVESPQWLRDHGYDGVILRPRSGTMDEVMVLDPEQVKSVWNRGTFDPADSRIRYSMAADRAGLTPAELNDPAVVAEMGTESPHFKRWSGGAPYLKSDYGQVRTGQAFVVRLKHGTAGQFDSFDPAMRGTATNAPDAGRAFWFTDNPGDAWNYAQWAADKAERLAWDQPRPKERTIDAFVRLQNPLVIGFTPEKSGIDPSVFSRISSDKRATFDYAEDNGHDGVVWPFGNENDAGFTVAVFSPEQIKSVSNRGTFDPADPRISYSMAERVQGAWTVIDGRGVMFLAKEREATTIHHETFHAAMDLALTPNEKQHIFDEFGDEEAAARAYEKWKPDEQPHTLFQKIRDFFRRVWDRLFKPHRRIFEDIRAGTVWEKERVSRPAGSWSPKLSTSGRKSTGRPTPAEADFVTLYSGFPLPEMVKLLKKAFRGSRRIFTGITEKDISLLDQATKIPDWLAKSNPDFRKVRDVQRRRDQNRNLIRHTYMTDLAPALTLKSRSAEKVGRALWRGDELVKVLPEKVLDRRFTPEEKAGYLAVRSVLDYIWKEDLPELMKELGQTNSEIDEYRRTVGIVGGYMPHPRHGRFYARVRDGADVLWREHFDDLVGLMTGGRAMWKKPAIEARLGKEFDSDKLFGPEIEFGVNKRTPEEVFFEVSPQVTEELIELALKKTPGPEAGKDVFRKALEKAVADLFSARGFMSHGIERLKVPGYDKSNWQDAVVEYVSGWAGFKSKLLASKELQGLWGRIDWSERPNLRAYADKYIRDNFTNTDQVDTTIDKVRAYFFHQYLGGVVKSASINLTQNYIATIPRLTAETKWAGIKVQREMAAAAGDLVVGFTRPAEAGLSRWETAQKRRLTAEEFRGLTRARNNGIVSDNLTQELMGVTLGEFGSVLRHLGDGLRYLFGLAERFNRETTYLTAFRIARKRGDPFEAAARFAEQIVEESHFNYGKSNLPPFVRGRMGRLARPFYTFRSYSDNLARGLWRSLALEHGWRGRAGLVKSLLALMFFGGLGGIPLYKSLEWLYQKMTGRNVRSEIAAAAGDNARWIFYGAPGLIGVDLSGSISIEAPRSLSEIAGVPYDWIKRTGQTYEDLQVGDYWRAAEDFPAMPQFARLPMQAARYRSQGQTTRGGSVIRDDDFEPVKLTTGEAVQKALGFQPVKLSEGYRKYEARKLALEFWNRRKDRVATALTVAYQRNGVGSQDFTRARADVDEFNREKPDFIPPIIIVRTLRERLAARPSRRERILQREIQ